MSVHVVAWVLDHSEERLGRRLVLLALAEKANEDGTGAWPSVKTLARQTRLSERQVHNCLRGLEADGAIERAGTSDYGTTNWSVVMEEQGGENIAPLKSTTEKVTRISPDPSLGPALREPGSSIGTSVSNLTTDPGSPAPGKNVAIRKRNLPFDALVEACPGTDPKVDGGQIAAALRIIRRRCVSEAEVDDPRGDPARAILDADAADLKQNRLLEWEIKRRAVLYRERWPDVELTPTALAKHWTRVLTDLPPGRRESADSIAIMFDE